MKINWMLDILVFIAVMVLAALFLGSNLPQVLDQLTGESAFFSNFFVFAAGFLIASLFNFGWLLAFMRKYALGKPDSDDLFCAMEAKIGIFNHRESLWVGIGTLVFFFVLSVGAYLGNDASVIQYNIHPLSLPIGFSSYFPLLYLKDYVVKKLVKNRKNLLNKSKLTIPPSNR